MTLTYWVVMFLGFLFFFVLILLDRKGLKKPMQSLKELTWTDCAKVALLIAIPLTVGVLSWTSNLYFHKTSVARDYIQIAVQVLQNPNKQDSLREWAVELIDNYAEVKLDPDLVEKLKEGEVLWPGEIATPLLSSLSKLLLVFERHRGFSVLGVTQSRGDFDEAMQPFLRELLPYADKEGCKAAISIIEKMTNVSGKTELLLQYQKKIENG